MISGGSKHATDLVVAALVQGDEGFLFTENFELGGEQRLALAVESDSAGGEKLGLVAGERPVESDVVNLPASGLGMDDFVKQLAVVRHEQEAGGVLIEPADGIESGIPVGKALGQEVVNGATRVLAAAGVAIRFVEHDDQWCERVERLATEEDVFVGRDFVFAQHGAHVVGDGTGFDEPLDFLAGAVAEIGEEFDEFHGKMS